MRKFTNAMRLLMVVALSLTIVVGSAQRSTPLSNKAPQQQVLTEQAQIAAPQQMKAVQDNVITEDMKNLVKGQQPVTPLNYFGATEVLFNYDKPMSSEPYDPSKFPAPKQGGETIATATVIGSLPYSDAGTTSGYLNDYDEACPYTGSTSPDVCYSYTPGVNGVIDIDLCGSSYDTKVYVYENSVTPGAPYACNDDYYFAAPCYVYSSAILGLSVTGGNTYYIIVDGYGGSSGNYLLEVENNVPCVVTCPSGGIPEGEGDILDEGADNFNGGCNSTPNVFSPISCGQTICGNWNTYTVAGADNRDTDWYIFTLTDPFTEVTWTVTGEFPSAAFILTGVCPTSVIASATAAPCAPATVTAVLAAGTYYLFAGGSVFTGYPAGGDWDYTASLTCAPVGGPTGCEFTAQYPSGTIPVSSTGLITTISTCSFAGEFSALTNIQAGQTYQFTMSDLGTGAYITITDGPGTSGNVLTHGPSPLSYVAATGADLYAHWSLNSSCATDGSCHTTTAQCTTCSGGTPPPNDNCANAQAVNGPYPVVGIAGTTINSTPDCPGVLDQPGVWYAINLPYAENKVIIDLCGTTLDNGWVVGFPDCSCTGFFTADSWNFVAPCVYDLTWNNIAGPGTFYYNVWTGTTQSNFVLDVDVQQAVPCVVTCPVGGIPEGEATIPDEGLDLTNGGCNSTPPVFTSINVGDTYCGMANTYLFGGAQYRDTDWYRLDLTGSPLFWDLTWTVTAEFPLLIFMVDGGTENCADYTILGSTTAAPCVTASLTFTGLQPKVYWVLAMPSVFTGVPPSDYVATLTGTGVAPPVATFNPTSFTKQLAPGASTSDVLAVGNTGGIVLNYTANVVYGAKASAVAYPQNANYWTGSVDNTTPPAVFSQTSMVNGIGEEAGWFMFDVSGIPDGATILSVEFNGYANACNWPYWSLTPLTSNPLTASADVLYADIIAEEGANGDYNFFTEPSTAVPGWRVATLGGTANADLQAALAQNWFAIGMAETDHFATYYINFDGWNETNKPYIVVNYTTTPLWLTIDGGQSTSGSVAPGGSNNIAVGFNAAGLSAGTYHADIVFATNEPGAKATHIVPVTLTIGYRVYGNVYYGISGNTKPMATNTSVTLTPFGTVPTGALGYYEFGGVTNGAYKLTGATTKTGGGVTTADGITVARFAVGLGTLTNLQLRCADVNMSNSISTTDGILVKRRAVGLSTPAWTAPVYVFDGPFGIPNPVLDGLPVNVSGADVTQEFRTLCSGDVNGSFTPAP